MVQKFKQTLNLTTILKTIKINRSTYYYWVKIQLKNNHKMEIRNIQQKRIKEICKSHRYHYGHRKIAVLYRQIYKEDITTSKIYQIMKENGICCRLKTKK
ncbi:IS3 family transposase [Candidatus Phytoplasma australiense]|uniref:Putative transposase tra5 for insertion sequence element IS150 n=1 Tax=Strawberry lethal yellows phytoplasma (CPA) str. NZSb11 TaxID=980422 RepID=R4S0A0_PHYAS|nr:IS3 family transposase [Candidatus Phytoplasma australiense]AGL90183.1 Putative transposase tra5 for insertion sequence element IS150 [Strawberry lethal yellows phytoplasma (CPA) str. NZSb11]